jgi:hypothetical protein
MEPNEVYNEGAQNPQETPKRPALHKECQRYLDSIPEMVKTVKANSKRFEFLDKLKEEFQDCYSYSSAYAPCVQWEITFQFETFAQAKRVLKRMAEAGIKRDGKVIQSAEYGFMVWMFKDWKITGNFKSEKENACRYVKTGTKMVEQPIYELKCSEAFDPQFKPAVVETDEDGLPF